MKDKRIRWGGIVGHPRPNRIKIRKEKGWTIKKQEEQNKILKELGNGTIPIYNKCKKD